MANVNKVILIGNLTRDPEVRHTPKGTAVGDIALAINRAYTAENGEKREDTTYVDVTLWGRTAEIAQQYLRKGRPVYIEGRLQMDSWEDKATGQKRSKLKVVAEALQLLGGRGEGDSGGGGGGGSRRHDDGYNDERPSSRSEAGSASHAGPDDDDIPF
ncbi:MAG: single-stranded DNA-binding protein [Verrucomicrobiales bacterium]